MACGRSSQAICSSSPIRTEAVASGAAAKDALAWLALVRASTSAVSLRRLIDNQGSAAAAMAAGASAWRSEEHTSELQSLMRISYAVFCLKKKKYELCEH